MTQPPIVIIGAGPAGLTAAYQLSQAGETVLVLEQDSRVGGIARTECYQGYRFDIGGHRFFTKIDRVQDFWFHILGDEFLVRPRLSRILYQKNFYDYPLKLSNVLQNLGPLESGKILASYLKARLQPHSEELTFEQWVSNRFGRRLYEIFFKTYTEKVWGIPCDQISAEWAEQRIKGLSLFSAVRNALIGQTEHHKIKTLINEFYYPRYGPGMLWETVQKLLLDAGQTVLLNAKVTEIQHNQTGQATGVMVETAQGRNHYRAKHIISTMPLQHLVQSLTPQPNHNLLTSASTLTYRDFLTVVLVIDQSDLFPDNWLYIHTPEVLVGRIQNFKNWSPDLVPDSHKTSLGLEYFCAENDVLWKKTDDELIVLAQQELVQLGLVNRIECIEAGAVFRQKKAYPVYTGVYKTHLKKIKIYIDEFANLQTIGRNGLHMYNNQDHSMLTAMLAVENYFGANHNVWQVNVERAYHEEFRVADK